jgi:hypothetical protein
MKNRIIKIEKCDHCIELLLFLVANNDWDVNLIAWHKTDDSGETMQHEIIGFENILLAEQYISDFSEESANKFVNDFIV